MDRQGFRGLRVTLNDYSQKRVSNKRLRVTVIEEAEFKSALEQVWSFAATGPRLLISIPTHLIDQDAGLPRCISITVDSVGGLRRRAVIKVQVRRIDMSK